jgi:phospholipid/cholesterol/gamma-HCH transport system substrate-binding protein
MQRTYTIHVRFPDAPGVGESTPVRNRGILIGRVTHVDFTDDGQVLVSAAIDRNRALYRNEVCMVRTTLIGDAMLQFQPAEDQPVPPPLKQRIEPNETIQGATSRDALQMIRNLEPQLNELMKSAKTTSDELGGVARKLSVLLDDNQGQLNRLITKTEATLDSVQKAMTSADRLLGDDEIRNNLRRGLAELPETMREARQTIAGLEQTLELANRNFRNLEGFTEPLGRRGDEFFRKLDSTVGKAEILLDRLVVFGDALNNREGSLGRLTNDPELYDNLSRAAKNVEELTRQLRPIVADVRVITDKVARDPGRLGVRGIFQQPSGIK